MKRIASTIALGLAGIFSPQSNAEKLTAVMPVRLTMVGACNSISATPLDFGVHRYPDRPTDVTAKASIHARCSRGTHYTVELDEGHKHGHGEARRMSGDFNRPYELYKDPGMTQKWGSGNSGATGLSGVMGASEAAVHTVYGRVRLPSSGPLGVGTDTVTVTLRF